MKGVLLCALILFHSPSWALDTTEAFAPGLSDFEFYGSHSRSERTLSLVTGYGHSHWLNPSLGIEHRTETTSEEAAIDTSFSISNFATVFSGLVEVDVLAGFCSKEDAGLFIGDEWTLPLGRYVPYLSNSFESNQGEFNHTATLGLSFQQNQNIELFAESGWDMSQGGEHTSLALGVNVLSTAGLEVLAEAGMDVLEDQSYASLGLIWTLD